MPDPGFGGSGLAGNSVDDGGLAPLDPSHWGKSSTLTFWAEGDASQTGNVNFSLRYLNANGDILNPVVNTSFGDRINPSGWTQIRLNGPAIPNNTSAIFVEMTLAVGPTGVQPPGTCGVDSITGLPLPCDFRQARVLIDDVSLRVEPWLDTFRTCRAPSSKRPGLVPLRRLTPSTAAGGNSELFAK